MGNIDVKGRLCCEHCGGTIRANKLEYQLSRGVKEGPKSKGFISCISTVRGYCTVCDRYNEIKILNIVPRDADKKVHWQGTQVKPGQNTSDLFYVRAGEIEI